MCCGSRGPLSRSTDREENIVFAAFICGSPSCLARLLSQSLPYHYSGAHDRLIHIDCRVATADRWLLWRAVSMKKGCMKAFLTIETFHLQHATRQLMESAVARSSDRLGYATSGLICISLDRDAGRFGLGGGDDDASRALDRGNRLFGGGKLWRWDLRNSSPGSKTQWS